MKKVKRLAALFLALLILPAAMPAAGFATDFEDELASMAVVPGSPADPNRSQASSEPSAEPSSAPEPSSSQPEESSEPDPDSSSEPAVNYPVFSSRQENSSGWSQEDPDSSSEASSRYAAGSAGASSSDISLPSVGSVSEAGELIASGTEVKTENQFNIIGIISWACIGLGVVVVVIVLLSTTRKPPRGGSGRKRYRRKPNKPRKKRLLNDKYYRNIKY